MCEVLWMPMGGGQGRRGSLGIASASPREEPNISSQRGMGHEVGPWRSADEGVAVRTSGWARRPDAGERRKERWSGGAGGAPPQRSPRGDQVLHLAGVASERGSGSPGTKKLYHALTHVMRESSAHLCVAFKNSFRAVREPMARTRTFPVDGSLK